jgi:hypothetical protein
MPFIIGQASTITFGSLDQGIVSVSWQEGKGFTPLYQLGSDSIYAIESNQNQTLNVTIYGNAGSPSFSNLDVPNCTDSSLKVNITFTPGLCPSTGAYSFSNREFFVNSYSYSKDVQGVGQESWSLVAKPGNAFYMMTGSSLNITSSSISNTPTIVMINGLPTGQFYSEGVTSGEAGVTLHTSNLTTKTMDVSSGALSLGKAKTITQGFVSSFGGSTLLKKDGSICETSVNVEYNPIYTDAG